MCDDRNIDASGDGYPVDDEDLAQDMRAYLAFVCSQPDPIEYCSALAEEDAIDRMEAEGITGAEHMIDTRPC
jgi:hypothetical protein